MRLFLVVLAVILAVGAAAWWLDRAEDRRAARAMEALGERMEELREGAGGAIGVAK